MNTENRADPTPSPEGEVSQPVPVNTAGSRRGPGWLALLLALAGIALGGYASFELYKQKSDSTVQVLLQQRDNRIDQLQQRLESVGSAVSELQGAIDELDRVQRENAESVRKLAGSLAVENIDLALAEIEQLLVMAVHHLTLQREVRVALAAIEAADTRLASLGNNELQPVRDQLATDRQALQAVNAVDLNGLSLYLSDLADRVQKLPLASTSMPETLEMAAPVTPDGTTPAWRRLLAGVWQEFRQMFVITRTGDGTQATLLPEESWYLYQNLRLQIETARLAAFRHDTATLRNALQQVDNWLTNYFDTTDTNVANVRQTVQKMSELELAPRLPDISSSLETLRAYIHNRLQDNGQQP